MRIEGHFRRLFIYLESKSRLFNFCVGLACVSVVILLDALYSGEYQFAFFYLFPVGFTTWFAGRFFGLFLVLICSLAWVIDNHPHYSLSLVWNTFSTIGIFMAICLLVNRVRIMWEDECRQSRRDFLTGFLNARALQETLEYEINRLTREGNPLTLAYIDLDNFKEVNDRFGHPRGDELLKYIAGSLSGGLRKTDVLARMGGDEFVILLPGTNQEAARNALHKTMGKLLNDLKEEHWVTTVSVGVVTCLESPRTSDELIMMADDLMYKVKQDGKNGIKFTVYPPGRHLRL